MEQIQYKKDYLNSKEIEKPSKSLKFLRVLTMILKIISLIIFILSIINVLIFCSSSILTIACKDRLVDRTTTLETWINKTYGISVYTASFVMLNLTFATGGWIALGWLSWLYFGKNYKEETPFTFRSSRDLIRLAIVAGGIAVVTIFLFIIIYPIYYANFRDNMSAVGYFGWPFIFLGLVYLILSFVVRHTAEIREQMVKDSTKLNISVKKLETLKEKVKTQEKQIKELKKALSNKS